MPYPNTGEKKNAYIPRCISVVKDEHPDWSLDKVIAVCHKYWENRNMSEKEKLEYEEFSLSVPLTIDVEKKTVTEPTSFIDDNGETINCSEGDVLEKEHYATAIIADKFYHGAFFPAAEVEKVYKQWEGTLHDINHMGTTHLMGLGATSDIRFFVGWNSDVSYDTENKSVQMKINIDDNTKYSDVWHSYVNLCKKAGQTPNVSIHFLGLKRRVKASDLPSNVDYKQYGFADDDEVLYIYNIIPRALSTVLTGVCNDKTGCGININNCKDGKCNLSDEPSEDEIKYEEAKQLLIKQLKEMEA